MTNDVYGIVSQLVECVIILAGSAYETRFLNHSPHLQ